MLHYLKNSRVVLKSGGGGAFVTSSFLWRSAMMKNGSEHHTITMQGNRSQDMAKKSKCIRTGSISGKLWRNPSLPDRLKVHCKNLTNLLFSELLYLKRSTEFDLNNQKYTSSCVCKFNKPDIFGMLGCAYVSKKPNDSFFTVYEAELHSGSILSAIFF